MGCHSEISIFDDLMPAGYEESISRLRRFEGGYWQAAPKSIGVNQIDQFAHCEYCDDLLI